MLEQRKPRKKREPVVREPIKVDISKPRSVRPMVGLDIEQWRGELGLTKFDAQMALGFRNSNHYNRTCKGGVLDAPLEILIRLFEEIPSARGWQRYSLKELFDIMYGKELEVFKNTRYETHASVDLGARFTRIFGRSTSRKYEWLDPRRNEAEINANAVLACILNKLKQADDPKELLERVAKKVWALRGVDLDVVARIPTLDNPPQREKSGRKRAQRDEPVALAKSAKTPKAQSAGVVKAPAKKTVAKPKAVQTPESALKKAVGVKAAPAARKSQKKQ